MKQATLAVRVNQKNPDHHIWDNHGVWWCHLTLHLPNFTKVRIRQSLETKELTLARARRDALLQRRDCSGLLREVNPMKSKTRLEQ